MASRRLAAVPDRQRTAPDLRESVRTSIAGMTWLEPADQALADLALALADQIESAQARADELERLVVEADGEAGLIKRLRLLEEQCGVAKMVGWLGPQLQIALKDLGGAPSARRSMTADKPVGSRLAELRAAADAAKGPSKPRTPRTRTPVKRGVGKHDPAAVDAPER